MLPCPDICLNRAGEKSMRKVAILVIIGFSLMGCSLRIPELLVGLQSNPTMTQTLKATATQMLSITPLLPTPTFTLTPTLIGPKTATETSTPIPSDTPGLSPTPVTPTTSTPTPRMNGFTSIRLSGNQFYLKGCDPSMVNFLVQAADANRTAFVILFVRFKSHTTGATSVWTSITMENQGGGTFTHNLSAEEMTALELFVNPWVQYQLVATNASRSVIGRTQIFDEVLALTTNCTPTPSATLSP
jgi:hypothetical protein